jgi:hypothetical protein
MPRRVVDIFACWRVPIAKGQFQLDAVWKMMPCLMWCLWKERNGRSFEDHERTSEELNNIFFKTLSSGCNLIL